MLRTAFATMALLAILGCAGGGSDNQPQARPAPEPQPRPVGALLFYTEADLKKIALPHGVTALPPRLHSFFTDPAFRYLRHDPDLPPSRAWDYDLRLELTFQTVWWLDPLNAHGDPKHAGDLAFLAQLNQDYGKELKAVAVPFQQNFNRAPLTTTGITRLADNNLATLLDAAAPDPKAMEMMRKVLYYCLTR